MSKIIQFLLIACLFQAQLLPLQNKKRILFFGDSLTAGYGISQKQAFPHLVKQKIDSLNLPFSVVNGGLSGETSSGGLRRIDWLLKQQTDILVLELGGNDALRGLDLNLTQNNLQAIINKARTKYPNIEIILAGMQAPPNLGSKYVDQFKAIYPHLAKENKTALIPFLLAGVGGIPQLNLPDGIHPTVKGHKIVAEIVWKTLRPILLKTIKQEAPR